MLPPMASAALTPYVVVFLPDGLDIGARSWYIVLARPVTLRFVRGRSARNVRVQPNPHPIHRVGVFLCSDHLPAVPENQPFTVRPPPSFT